jgi:hypothetical protein
MLYLPYYPCVFSSTKLVVRADQDLLGTKEGREGEMTQTMYAHVNK